jgi:hypothetical protein
MQIVNVADRFSHAVLPEGLPETVTHDALTLSLIVDYKVIHCGYIVNLEKTRRQAEVLICRPIVYDRFLAFYVEGVRLDRH